MLATYLYSDYAEDKLTRGRDFNGVLPLRFRNFQRLLYIVPFDNARPSIKPPH
jgi:hypothetical protein